MNNFWNERYSEEEYAYGENPNEFVKHELQKIKPGKALFPAEGEGRNAVYTATLGWEVTAFDPSTEGKRKAELLADNNNVSIEYIIAGYENIELPKAHFDCLILVFAHVPSAIRPGIHKKLSSFLKPGGNLILEAFSKEQINYKTGGPQNPDYLFSEKDLYNDFDGFSELKINVTEKQLNEGPFHQGVASVIRVIAKK